ncbi:hypothetical protein [Spirillospora albida]|uniref:hypothetical protein n=1 Tax=Spirillospora albida TaxID=58123 RepID=UPI0004BF3D58|nr:hypothetical protein [Spirillospora albida]
MDDKTQANPAYAEGQMAKAFVTALAHEDAPARRRAEERLRRWAEVAAGMVDGTLRIGSRTPVEGLPAWVTPEVVRGGFATGTAAAGGPLLEHEEAAAERAGVAPTRRALFLYSLTDAGMAELSGLLDSGRYDAALPEETALPVMAWLLRAGDPARALDVLEAIGPFSDRLRFRPRPGAAQEDPSLVCRTSVGQVRGGLASRRPNARVAAMNEALTVWNPFADVLLAHWLETVRDGRVGAVEPGGWRERGAELIAEYRRLASENTLCTKHDKPGENLAVLRESLEDVLDGRAPSRLLPRAVESMVAKRGLPGTGAHAALRARQAGHAARPTHHEMARIVLARLSEVPAQAGLPATEPYVRAVTADEERRTGVPEGTELPDRLRACVESALRAPVETLVERGLVPSAEVLARLVPQLTAAAVARAYEDEALQKVVAATYRAFRNRRSLLLLNLESQVRVDELPWMKAVEPYRRRGAAEREGAREVLVQLGELALQGFPGTLLPNTFVRELTALAKTAGVDAPFVEELAADIFMGAFAPKFLRAAKLAGELLDGTLYARYYGIDYTAVRAMSDGFAQLCRERADVRRGGSWVAANGMVIEQAQILTTHNLAALVHVGADPVAGWDDLARRAFGAARRLVRSLAGRPRPLGTVKDAAYAWRQAVFFLSLCGLKEQVSVLAWMQDELDRSPGDVARRLGPAVAGLRQALTGAEIGASPAARRFTGWSTGGHWILS